jgi:serine phosphatase RsbU (regulator of sigma subunit)
VEIELDLPATDPLADYLLRAARPVDIRDLELDSPALSRLRDSGLALVVPLISAGTLIGVLGLGPRRYEREYSTDDMSLLTALAGYAAPALRVGQLVREQRAETLRQERLHQQLQVAQLVQQHFLPDALPDLPGWQVAACYRPALTVSGDFYDFIPLPGGQALVVIGDVADKGVPAAFVMASTHALLRTAGPRLVSPAAVLGYVNDQLHADLPASMFVTCMALLLDGSGQIRYANAGHDVPYVQTADGVAELRARGMPLGMMPGSGYEEKSFRFRPGDCALLYSDGLSEAHAADREMFGCHRVAELVGAGASGQPLIDACLAALAAFTGPGSQQEDDITLVCLQRTAVPGRPERAR